MSVPAVDVTSSAFKANARVAFTPRLVERMRSRVESQSEELMKSVGIIGGIGPESTIEYYRLIIASYRERTRDGSYPSVVINSIDVKRMLDLIGANNLLEVEEYLVGELERLAGAGVDFAALAANTPHIVFGALRDRSPVPLISIVEVTRDAAAGRGLKRVGLFGTRFTMQASFYPEACDRAGITVVPPDPRRRSTSTTST